MRDITPFTGPMSGHTKDRLKNTMNPMNINQDPFIKNDPFVQHDLEMFVPGYQRPKQFNDVSSTRTRRTRRRTSSPSPLSLDDFLVVVGVFILMVVLIIAVGFIGFIYQEFQAEIVYAIDILKAFIVWCMAKAQIINNVPAVAIISALAHLITMKMYKAK